MAHVCVRHPYELSEDLCPSCGYDFCRDCLVYPKGRNNPPLCVPCALEAGGVRTGARALPKLPKREIKQRIKERQREKREERPAPEPEPEPEPVDSAFSAGWSLSDDPPPPGILRDIDDFDRYFEHGGGQPAPAPEQRSGDLESLADLQLPADLDPATDPDRSEPDPLPGFIGDVAGAAHVESDEPAISEPPDREAAPPDRLPPLSAFEPADDEPPEPAADEPPPPPPAFQPAEPPEPAADEPPPPPPAFEPAEPPEPAADEPPSPLPAFEASAEEPPMEPPAAPLGVAEEPVPEGLPTLDDVFSSPPSVEPPPAEARAGPSEPTPPDLANSDAEAVDAMVDPVEAPDSATTGSKPLETQGQADPEASEASTGGAPSADAEPARSSPRSWLTGWLRRDKLEEEYDEGHEMMSWLDEVFTPRSHEEPREDVENAGRENAGREDGGGERDSEEDAGHLGR